MGTRICHNCRKNPVDGIKSISRCTKCFNLLQKKNKPKYTAISLCHPDKKHEAHGLCKNCYQIMIYHTNEISKARTKINAYYSQLRRSYGLSKDDYWMLWAEQGGMCAICGKSDIKLSVDHDHKTGKIRGLLCQPCNLILGHVEKYNNIDYFLTNVNKYLNTKENFYGRIEIYD